MKTLHRFAIRERISDRVLEEPSAENNCWHLTPYFDGARLWDTRESAELALQRFDDGREKPDNLETLLFEYHIVPVTIIFDC